MKVTNIASGSKGNITFVEANSTKILVDIGISLSRVEKALKELGSSAEKIDAVLITHEHSDHIGGLECFAKKYPHVHIYTNKLVWKEVSSRCPTVAGKQEVHFFEYDTMFSVGEFSCCAMENYHDSKSCASFIISCGGGKLGICTDLGIITEHQIDMLSQCKVVYLECNHDKKMLAECAYPAILKKRISGKNGHLSNDQCATSAAKLALGQTKVIVLSHISENSNTPELAYSRVADELEMANIKNTILLLAYQNKIGKTITIN